MSPKAFLQKKTVADIDFFSFFYHHILLLFFSDGETEPERRSKFAKAAENVGSLIKSESKRIWGPKLVCIISIHKPWVWNGEEVRASREKEHMTGRRHSLPSLWCTYLRLRESRWVACFGARGAQVHGRNPGLSSDRASEKTLQSLPLTQTLQSTISYYVSITKFNPPASWD